MIKIIKEIKNYNHYYVDEFGNIYSDKYGDLRKLSPYKSRNGYVSIKLKDNNGITHHVSVHRAVAEAFIENPFNKEEVNHIDCNKSNNYYKNLEWATRKENMAHEFKRKSPIRNQVKRKIIFPDGTIMFFDNYNLFRKYAIENNLDVSLESLNYNGESRGFKMEKIK